MCGIFGLMNFKGDETCPQVLKKLSNGMIHRGPDGEGLYSKHGTTIGMRRLAIIDVDGGQQPITNEDGTLHIVLNGEIYNYKELRVSLERRGHVFVTNSDVEAVLHLYEEEQEEGLKRINGMFALCIFNSKSNELFLARDRLGIKPLFFHRNKNSFFFSSELNALARTINSSIDRVALIDVMGFSYVPSPRTVYNGIQKLPAGHMIKVTSSGIHHKRYWGLSSADKFCGSRNEAIEETLHLLRKATSIQMQSDVPLGVYLSGGVDSSAIATLAAKNTKDPLRTFSACFEGKNSTDPKFAKQVSNLIGSNHTEVVISSHSQMSTLEKMMPFIDEPLVDSALVPTYLLAEAAASEGVKVMLSGAGGDELFAGYDRHFPGKFFSPAWMASTPLRQLMFYMLLRYKYPNHAERIKTAPQNFAVSISGVDLDFMSEYVADLEMEALKSRIEQVFSQAPSSRKKDLLQLDMETYLLDNILSLTDKATMAASVEGRVPLLDHTLVELVTSFPETFIFSGAGSKPFFKSVLASTLPNELLLRKKEGFNAPIPSWMLNDQSFIKRNLFDSLHPILLEIVNLKAISKHLSNPELVKRSASSLYNLVVINMWLNTHV